MRFDWATTALDHAIYSLKREGSQYYALAVGFLALSDDLENWTYKALPAAIASNATGVSPRRRSTLRCRVALWPSDIIIQSRSS